MVEWLKARYYGRLRNPKLMQPGKAMHQKVSCSLTRRDCSDIKGEGEDGEAVFSCRIRAPGGALSVLRRTGRNSGI